MIDRADRTVRRLLREGAAAAHLRGDTAAYDPRRICGCSHWDDSHHGPDGAGACGEAGCDCAGWHHADVECPDCGSDWPLQQGSCPRCGLIVEEIAARLAAPRLRALTDRGEE